MAMSEVKTLVWGMESARSDIRDKARKHLYVLARQGARFLPAFRTAVPESILPVSLFDECARAPMGTPVPGLAERREAPGPFGESVTELFPITDREWQEIIETPHG